MQNSPELNKLLQNGGKALVDLALRPVTYAEKRKDPRWQRKRLEIMQRDGFKCCACGRADRPLNVHHHYYISGRDPWDYLDFALTTLCDDCHTVAHKPSDDEEESFLDWEYALDFVVDNLSNVDLLWRLGQAFGVAVSQGADGVELLGEIERLCERRAP